MPKATTIEHNELKLNALQTCLTELGSELAEIKNKASKPTRTTRTNKKDMRLLEVVNFYTMRKIKQLAKKK